MEPPQEILIKRRTIVGASTGSLEKGDGGSRSMCDAFSFGHHILIGLCVNCQAVVLLPGDRARLAFDVVGFEFCYTSRKKQCFDNLAFGISGLGPDFMSEMISGWYSFLGFSTFSLDGYISSSSR